jgi:quinol monooxygenase YgiN
MACLFFSESNNHITMTDTVIHTCHFQSKEDPCVFLLSEEYSDEDAWQSHRSSEHVRRFRADSADWVAQRQWWFWRTANEG